MKRNLCMFKLWSYAGCTLSDSSISASIVLVDLRILQIRFWWDIRISLKMAIKLVSGFTQHCITQYSQFNFVLACCGPNLFVSHGLYHGLICLWTQPIFIQQAIHKPWLQWLWTHSIKFVFLSTNKSQKIFFRWSSYFHDKWSILFSHNYELLLSTKDVTIFTIFFWHIIMADYNNWF